MKLEIEEPALKIKTVSITQRETGDIFFNKVLIGAFRPDSAYITTREVVKAYLREVGLLNWEGKIYHDSELTKGIINFSSFDDIKNFLAKVKTWIIKTDIEEKDWKSKQEKIAQSAEI
jgi:hypothetical protein